MTTMNISLPDEMKVFIEAQMATEGFASASEYLRTLIREAETPGQAGTGSQIPRGVGEWPGHADDARGLGRLTARGIGRARRRNDSPSESNHPPPGGEP